MDANSWALLTQALSQGVGAHNEDRAHRRQSREFRRGLRQQEARQAQADARLSDVLTDIEGSGPEAERTRLNDEYMQQLMRTRRQQTGSLPTLATGSARHAADTEAARADVSNYGTRLADIMARVDAPHLQRRQEHQAINRGAVDVGQIANFAQGDDFLARLRASQIRPNPWVAALSSLGGRIGQLWLDDEPAGDGLSEIDLSRLPRRRLTAAEYEPVGPPVPPELWRNR